MLKKILIGLVVLSFVALSARAATQLTDYTGTVEPTTIDNGDIFKLKAYGWDATVEFKPLDLDFKVPVYMDIGLFFQINNKKNLVNTGIKLHQVAINKFEGCSIAMEIQSNFDMVLGATVAPTDDYGVPLGGTWSAKIMDEACETESAAVPKTLSPVVEKRKIWVQLKDAKVYELDYGKNKHVANVTLNVKPKSIEIVWVDP
jgi:hypothetical protein